MSSGDAGHAPRLLAEEDQLVSLLEAFEEVLLECLSARSNFISGQRGCVAANGDLQVPAEAARAWIRGMLSTPSQLQRLSTTTLIQYAQGSGFFQDSHLVSVLCSVLGERLLTTDATGATDLSTEQPSAKAPRLHPAHFLDQLPTDLAIEVLRCAPGTISSQLRQLPQSLRSLVALAAFPALAAACTLPSDCSGAATDLPTLTLCVDVGHLQAGEAHLAALASAETTSHSADAVSGSSVARGSIWVCAPPDVDSEEDVEDATAHMHWNALEGRPHVVACALQARSDSLPDLSLKLPNRTCLVLDSKRGVLDIHRAKFEGVSFHSPVLICFCIAGKVNCLPLPLYQALRRVPSPPETDVLLCPDFETHKSPHRLTYDIRRAGGAVVCMGSTCSANFRNAVFDKCSLVVVGGAQATFHNPLFKNMAQSEGRLSVLAHGSGTQLQLHGGCIHGGRQGVAVQEAAHLQASDLHISGLEHMGLEVSGEESTLILERGHIHSFADHEYLGHVGVEVHTGASACISGLTIASMCTGCGFYRASATVADCNMSDISIECVRVCAGSTVDLDNCTLSGREGDDCVGICVSEYGSHATATHCRVLGGGPPVHVRGGGTYSFTNVTNC